MKLKKKGIPGGYVTLQGVLLRSVVRFFLDCYATRHIHGADMQGCMRSPGHGPGQKKGGTGTGMVPGLFLGYRFPLPLIPALEGRHSCECRLVHLIPAGCRAGDLVIDQIKLVLTEFCDIVRCV